MGLLFDVESHTINYHIKKIFDDNKLLKESTARNFRVVQNEGNRTISRDLIHYNLQMIIAVGFKVNPERAVQFCKWVNQIAIEYTIKGCEVEDERLIKGTYLTDRYF